MPIHCTSCGAPIHQLDPFGSFRCRYCDARSGPDPQSLSAEGLVLSGHDEDRNCPVCEVPLQSGRVKTRTPVVGCRQCHGFLVEHEELGWLIQCERKAYVGSEVMPQRPDVSELSRRIACPACLGPMEAYFYAGPGNSFIDGCYPCGLVWLDAGELQRIVTAPGRREDPGVAWLASSAPASASPRPEPGDASTLELSLGAWLSDLLGL